MQRERCPDLHTAKLFWDGISQHTWTRRIKLSLGYNQPRHRIWSLYGWSTLISCGYSCSIDMDEVALIPWPSIFQLTQAASLISELSRDIYCRCVAISTGRFSFGWSTYMCYSHYWHRCVVAFRWSGGICPMRATWPNEWTSSRNWWLIVVIAVVSLRTKLTLHSHHCCVWGKIILQQATAGSSYSQLSCRAR